MSSEILRAFLCELHVITHDRSSFTRLTNHTINVATHHRPDITSDASELRDVSNKIRHVTVHGSK